MGRTKNWWKQVTFMGIGRNVSSMERLAFTMLNRALVVSTFLSFFYTLSIFLVGSEDFLLTLPILASLLIGTALAYRGKHILAQHIIAHIITFAILLGKFTGEHSVKAYFLFIPIGAAIYLVGRKMNFLYYNFLFLLTIIIGSLHLGYIGVLNSEEKRIEIILFVICFYIMIGVMYYFRKELEKNERKIAEQQKIIQEGQFLAQIGTWTYNYRNDKVFFSEQLLKMLGLETDVKPNLEKHLMSFIPTSLHDKINHFLSDPNQVTPLDIEFETLPNKNWYRITGNILSNSADNVPKFIGTLQNVTSMKQIEELQNLNKALQRSNQELEQFAYIASHDLQEPLRMVGNFVQLLEEEYSDEVGDEGKLYIQYAVNGVTRMSTQIDELLRYSRLGRNETPKQSINVSELIQNKLEDIQIFIQERNAQVTLESLPEKIWATPDLIGLVFQNLIHNGIKFNNDPAPIVKITSEEKGKYQLFKITDNGIGIASSSHDKIFQIFNRLHRKEDYKGVGIGLAVVKRIILKQGGDIWVESEKGKGSTFYFTLPKS